MCATRAAIFLTAALGCSGAGGAGPPAASPAPAPAPVPPPAAAGLDDLLAGDLAAEAAFPWSAARRLAWRDFQGAPQPDGPEGARIAYGLYYAWRCRGAAFEFRAVAAFRPRQSWVKPIILNDPGESRRALAHEQTHFDLSEVHARRMRQHFVALGGACRRSDAELNDLARRFVREEKAEQRRYDAETNHGLLAGEQAAWSREVARRLVSLDRYGP